MKSSHVDGWEDKVQYRDHQELQTYIISSDFMLGYVKNIVYQSFNRNTDGLKSRITADIQNVDHAIYCHTHNLLQVPIAELAERWTELPQVSDESRSFFRVHTGYFSNIPKCIKAEFIASWACSQSSVVSSSKR
ncbi:hypothetical protein TNCV_343051 [Trichonephila clavipes]|nr:hypothetical protein TNCV_343051 [Trichonephila clavipes]